MGGSGCGQFLHGGRNSHDHDVSIAVVIERISELTR
jgi:hypothetical protein